MASEDMERRNFLIFERSSNINVRSVEVFSMNNSESIVTKTETITASFESVYPYQKVFKHKDGVRHEWKQIEVASNPLMQCVKCGSRRRKWARDKVGPCMLKPRVYEKWQARVIAMALDTDGSIGISKNKRKGTEDFRIRPSIQFYNLSKPLVDYVRNLIGYGVNVHAYKGDEAFNSKYKLYSYRTVGMLQQTLNLLIAIEPYLIVKREKAQLIIAFCKSRLSKVLGDFYSQDEIEMWKHCKELSNYGELREEPQ